MENEDLNQKKKREHEQYAKDDEQSNGSLLDLNDARESDFYDDDDETKNNKSDLRPISSENSGSKYLSWDDLKSDSKLKHRSKSNKIENWLQTNPKIKRRISSSFDSNISKDNQKTKLKSKSKKRKRDTTPESSSSSSASSYKVYRKRAKPPVFIDKRSSPQARYDIDIKDSYWDGIPLKIFQDRDIAKLLKLSEEYITMDMLINPTIALRQWILCDDEKVKRLPFLAGKTLAYDTDLTGFQAKALQDAFKMSNISINQVISYNQNCPTKPSLGVKTLQVILSKKNMVVDNDIMERQGIQLIQQTGGPVYCRI
jgi:hypothetical protein